MTDDGGSSGRLRSALGVLPPGDVRNCVLAGTRRDSPYRALLQHRFPGGSDLEGHAVGNLLLAMMSQVAGNFPDAVRELTRLVDSRVQVLPASADTLSFVPVVSESALPATAEPSGSPEAAVVTVEFQGARVEVRGTPGLAVLSDVFLALRRTRSC